MVTGANTGMGLQTAMALALAGAHVVLVCRDRDRGEDALRQVRAKTGNSGSELILADLSSQRSIRELSDSFLARHARLHILVNNAGLGLKKRHVSADGLEMTFAVNHMAYFLLTILLLGTLRASSPARIVNVSSAAHRHGRIDFGNLQLERGYSQFKSYSNSKLANVLFTYELARRLAGSKVSANCLHPGYVATDIWRDTPWVVQTILPLLLRSPAAGAATSIYLATSPEVEGLSGRYFVDRKETRSSAASHDEGVAARLWDVSCRLGGV